MLLTDTLINKNWTEINWIIIISIIIISYHIYALYLQLHNPNKPCTHTTVHNVAAMLQSQSTLHVMPFPTLHVLHLYISTLCAATNMAVFCSSLISCFPVRRSVILWMTFKWFQSPLLLLVSFCFYVPHALYFHCKVFVRIVISSEILSWSHFHLLKF